MNFEKFVEFQKYLEGSQRGYILAVVKDSLQAFENQLVQHFMIY